MKLSIASRGHDALTLLRKDASILRSDVDRTTWIGHSSNDNEMPLPVRGGK